ncbi:MAG: hypothetical protein FVQ78_01130 [Solirubrobacterales bacterium]|nr:hypothetical protein [Solirubrobacterales bacterium]
MGGNRTHARRSRYRAVAAGAAAAALAASVAACGGGSSPDANEPAGAYRVKVVTAEFPAKQRLGQTSLMRIGVRNTGRRTVPALTVTVSIAGRAGQTSSLPFAVHGPEPGLAQPDRPVWVLAAHYPKRAGSSKPGGTQSANQKTFNFGPLKPGATVEGVWKLSAVKTGRFAVLYEIDAGLSGAARAETASGVEPGGSFAARISEALPETIVTDSGRVVEIPKKRRRGAR